MHGHASTAATSPCDSVHPAPWSSPAAASPPAAGARGSEAHMGAPIAISRSASSSLSSFSSSSSSPRTSSASSATRSSVSSSLSSAASSAPLLPPAAPTVFPPLTSDLSVPSPGEEGQPRAQEEKRFQREAEGGEHGQAERSEQRSKGAASVERGERGWGRVVRVGRQAVQWALLAGGLLLTLAAVGVSLYASASFRPIAVNTRDTVTATTAAAINKLDAMSAVLSAAYAVFNRTLQSPALLPPAPQQQEQAQAQQKLEQQGGQRQGNVWASSESASGAPGSVGQGGNTTPARTRTMGSVPYSNGNTPCAAANDGAVYSSGNNAGAGAAGGSEQGWGNAVGRLAGGSASNGSSNGKGTDAASILVFARRALVSVHSLQRQAHALEAMVDGVARRALSTTNTALIALMAASCLLLLLSAACALVSCGSRRLYLCTHLVCMCALLALLLLAWALAGAFFSARVVLDDSCREMALYAATPAASTLAPLLPCLNPRAARIALVNAARGANRLVGFANGQIESGNAALGGLRRLMRAAGLMAGNGTRSGAGGGGAAGASGGESGVEGMRAGGLRGSGSSMGMAESRAGAGSSSGAAQAGVAGGSDQAAVAAGQTGDEESSAMGSSSSSGSGERLIPLLCPLFNESSNLTAAPCPAGFGSVRSFEKDYAPYHCESENPVVCVRRGTPIPNSSYHLLASAVAVTVSVADLVPDMYDLATCQFLIDMFQDLSTNPQGCPGAKSKVRMEWVAFMMFGVALTVLLLSCIIALYSYHKRDGDERREGR
ncbi:hypothetical protein CLOM_g21940 [Closterium sp. NIES-68]|nr:hypothetical protein CLOM_g21940 [Closterium sp. NIES-68]